MLDADKNNIENNIEKEKEIDLDISKKEKGIDLDISKKKKIRYCNNCGKYGHYFRECKYPITSYGIVCIQITPFPLETKQKMVSSNIKYLAVRRRNTLSYVEFIRGKYKFNDIDFLHTLFSRMTINERKLIENNSFLNLWESLWINDNFRKVSKFEYNKAFKKFDDLQKGVMMNYTFITIQKLLEQTISNYLETEWDFPKGRRNSYEFDIECAEREFNEETNLNTNDYEICKSIPPFIQQHIGSNNISYQTVYYIALSTSNKKLIIDKNNKHQYGEISKIGWYSFQVLMDELLRDYSCQKKFCLKNIHETIIKNFNEHLY